MQRRPPQQALCRPKLAICNASGLDEPHNTAGTSGKLRIRIQPRIRYCCANTVFHRKVNGTFPGPHISHDIGVFTTEFRGTPRSQGGTPLSQAEARAGIALPQALPHRVGRRRSWSIRRLTTAMAAAAMAPVLATMALVALLSDATPGRRQQTDRLMAQARMLADSLDRDLADLDTLLTLSTTGLSDSLAGGDRQRLRALQTSLRQRDSAAQVHLRAPEIAPPVASAMAGAIEQKRLTLSDAEHDSLAPGPWVHFLKPILNQDRVVAMLDVAVTPTFFQPALARFAADHAASRGDGPGQVTLRDPAGQVIAFTGGWARGEGWQDPPAILQARASLQRAPNWQVALTGPGGDGLAALIQRRAVPVLAALAAVLAGLGLAALFGDRLARRLQALTRHAGTLAVAADHTPEPLALSWVAEFEAMRLGLLHASAVLRRRLAAERVALREARTGHDLLDSVLNATAECITVKDRDLRYVLINRAALLIWPDPLDEWQVLGRCAIDLYPDAAARRMELADRAVLASGRMTSFELEIDWPSRPRAPCWLWVTITPWQDTDGRIVGVVTVSRDVTEQRAASLRLRSMQADMLRTARLSTMGAMAGGLAHELNQPLAAATNYLNASARLLDRAASARPELSAVRGAVADAAQQLLRAGAIVRRVRDFVGRGEAELQREDVGHLVSGVVDLARAAGITRGVELRFDPGPDQAVVLVDRAQIQQVLLNLIRNAAEAISPSETAESQDGLIRLATRVLADGQVCIDVSDNGPGIPAQVLARLFQPFVSTKPNGMGIGLTICHTIAEGHGGDLTAEALPEGGTRFRLRLPPVLQGPAAALPQLGALTRSASRHMP